MGDNPEHWAPSSPRVLAHHLPVEGTVLYVCLASMTHKGKNYSSVRPHLLSPCCCVQEYTLIESPCSIFHWNKALSQEAHYCLISRRQLLTITIINCNKLTCFTSAANFMLLQVNYSPWPGMSNPTCAVTAYHSPGHKLQHLLDALFIVYKTAFTDMAKSGSPNNLMSC